MRQTSYAPAVTSSLERKSQASSSIGSMKSTTLHLKERAAKPVSGKQATTRAVSVKSTSNEKSIAVTVGVLPAPEVRSNENDTYIVCSGRKESSAKQHSVSKAQMARLESKISELQS